MKTLAHIALVIAICMLLSSCGKTFDTDLSKMLANLQNSLGPVWRMLIALSYTLGIILVALSILKLKQYGHMTVMMSTNASMGPTFAYFLVGLGLLYLPTFLDVWIVTAWGQGSGLDSIEGGGGIGGHYADFMGPIMQIVQVIGLIAFLRGWLSLIRIGSGSAQPGTLSKGIMHMVGGILAINITGTINMLKATLGVA